MRHSVFRFGASTFLAALVLGMSPNGFAEFAIEGDAWALYFSKGGTTEFLPEVVESVDGIKLLHVPIRPSGLEENPEDPRAARFVTYKVNVTKLPDGAETARVPVRWMVRTYDGRGTGIGIRNLSISPRDYPDGSWIAIRIRADRDERGIDSAGGFADRGDIGGAMTRIDEDPTLSTVDFPPGTIDSTGFLTLELKLGMNLLMIEPLDVGELMDGCPKRYDPGHQLQSITLGPGIADLEGEVVDSAPPLALPLMVDVGQRSQADRGTLLEGYRPFDGKTGDGVVTQIFDNLPVSIDTGLPGDSAYKDKSDGGSLLRDFHRGAKGQGPGQSDTILLLNGLPGGTYTLTGYHHDPEGNPHSPVVPLVFGDVTDVLDGNAFAQTGGGTTPSGNENGSVGRSVVSFTGGGTVEVRYVNAANGAGGGASIGNPEAVFLNAFTLAEGPPGEDAPAIAEAPQFPEVPLKVDLNRGNHNLRRSLQSGYEPFDADDTGGQNAVTRTFSGVAITIDTAGAESIDENVGFEDLCAGGNLLRDYVSAGEITGPGFGDIIIRLEGLAQGIYDLTAFHNDYDEDRLPLRAFVGGDVGDVEDGDVVEHSALEEQPDDFETNPGVARSNVRFSTFGGGPVNVTYITTGTEVGENDAENVVVNAFILEAIPAVGLLASDANSDGIVSLSDAIRLVEALFTDNDAPLPCGDRPREGSNARILDHNGDRSVDLSDVVAIANFLFLEIGLPPALGTDCRLYPGCDRDPICAN